MMTNIDEIISTLENYNMNVYSNIEDPSENMYKAYTFYEEMRNNV